MYYAAGPGDRDRQVRLLVKYSRVLTAARGCQLSGDAGVPRR